MKWWGEEDGPPLHSPHEMPIRPGLSKLLSYVVTFLCSTKPSTVIPLFLSLSSLPLRVTLLLRFLSILPPVASSATGGTGHAEIREETGRRWGRWVATTRWRALHQGLKLAMPWLCILWPKGGSRSGVQPPFGGFYLPIAGARRRFTSKWFVPEGVEMDGDLGSVSARRESRVPSSRISA
jgi:hypothetical protein